MSFILGRADGVRTTMGLAMAGAMLGLAALGRVAAAGDASGAAAIALGQNTIADIADKTLPSVVSVYVKADMREQIKAMRKKLGPLRDKLFQDPRLHEFFQDQEPQDDPDQGADPDGDGADPHGGPMETRTSGSGVIITEDGYIVSNLHIVDGAKEGTISVVLNDDTEIPPDKVKVVATDDLIDLAILKIDTGGTKLTPLPWGDSTAMRIGDWVVAIGNPLDLRGSVSAGIISAKARKIEKVPIEHLLQTDAMINPGNSGGALVNLKGELIGINMAIATNTGFFQGIGFAIPSKDARFVADQVIQQGKVRRGYIGIEMGTLDDTMRKALGLSEDVKTGIVVTNVIPGAPADKAGVQAYDVITRVDDTNIKATSDLLGAIAGKPVGESAELIVHRQSGGKSKEHKLTMKVVERPSSQDLARQRGPTPTKEEKKDESPKDELGLTFKPGGSEGLEVAMVDPRSPAAKAGIAPGDVVLEVNRAAVKSAEDYRKAVGETEAGRPCLLRLSRGGAKLMVAVERPKHEK